MTALRPLVAVVFLLSIVGIVQAQSTQYEAALSG